MASDETATERWAAWHAGQGGKGASAERAGGGHLIKREKREKGEHPQINITHVKSAAAQNASITATRENTGSAHSAAADAHMNASQTHSTAAAEKMKSGDSRAGEHIHAAHYHEQQAAKHDAAAKERFVPVPAKGETKQTASDKDWDARQHGDAAHAISATAASKGTDRPAAHAHGVAAEKFAAASKAFAAIGDTHQAARAERYSAKHSEMKAQHEKLAVPPAKKASGGKIGSWAAKKAGG